MDIGILIEEIVAWLKKQVKDSNSRGLLVGVSGGLDSAVVANLIKKACPENSLGVIIPIHSSQNSLKDAKLLVEQCGIESLTIDLTQNHTNVLDNVVGVLKEKALYKESYRQMTDANLRARMRMASLYTVANNLGYMVVGTDNADEMYTGYFTKYGDGGVDILPLKEIYKSDVYKMGEKLGIPKSILEKAPSADLWENQTDEEEMGITYAALERYMKDGHVSPEEEKIIRSLHERSEHKRNVPAHFHILK